MSRVPEISCLLTDGKWYSFQIKALDYNEIQTTLRKWYPNSDGFNIIIKTHNNTLISNQKELENYFLYENKPEKLKINVLLEDKKKKNLRLDNINFSNPPNTDRTSSHNRNNTEASKLEKSVNPQMKRSATSTNMYLDKKFSELSKLIHDKFSSLETMIMNLTERIDSLESKIIDLPILSKPTFPKVTSEICEFSGFEITKEMIKSDKFSAIIELKNCSKKIFEKGYVLTQKEKLGQDIISFQRMTLNQDVHPNTTQSYKINFKLNKKLDQIQPHFIYKISVLIKDQSQMNVGQEFPLQFYFDYDVVLQNANLNRVNRPITMSSVKNEPNQQNSQQQAQQKSQPQAKQQAQQKSQQQPANKQSKYSEEDLKKLYDENKLEEFNIETNKIYKIIEECDGDMTIVMEKLENMI